MENFKMSCVDFGQPNNNIKHIYYNKPQRRKQKKFNNTKFRSTLRAELSFCRFLNFSTILLFLGEFTRNIFSINAHAIATSLSQACRE